MGSSQRNAKSWFSLSEKVLYEWKGNKKFKLMKVMQYVINIQITSYARDKCRNYVCYYNGAI